MRFIPVLVCAAVTFADSQTTQAPAWDHRLAQGNEHWRAGRYTQAEAEYRAALDLLRNQTDSPALAITLNNLGEVVYELGRYREAEKLLRRSLLIWERKFGATHPGLLQPLGNLASVYAATGNYGRAEQLRRRAYELAATTGSQEDAIRALHHLGVACQARGKHQEAEKAYRQALAFWSSRRDPDRVELGALWNNLGSLYGHTSRLAEAVSCFERALETWQGLIRPDHPYIARVLMNLAAAHWKLGRKERAQSGFEQALRVAESELGPDHPFTAEVLLNYAVVLRKSNQKRQAKEFERRGKAILKRNGQENLTGYTVDLSELR
ncbi:MAG: tetratricopeptide repeat protein [Bryobacteraceae bacterium]|jgi:tetratricopeptide (TPR) repeat protein|nr:tetratricopeptide repeat protein [Bryobacteraceae bacterium]